MRHFSKQFLRKNFLRSSLAIAGVACLALTSAVFLGQGRSPKFVLAAGQAVDGPGIDRLAELNKAYEQIAHAVLPAVVNIRTMQVVQARQSPFFSNPMWRQFFGNDPGLVVPQEQREHALGTGVIVSPNGYIVTNDHVVFWGKAKDIEVMLSDRRTFKAKIVGSDRSSDLAVLKIDAGNLPVGKWGNSSDLHVGDTVMAFGNPFGLNFTVTRGAVSALGRSGLVRDNFDHYIQTDAAINPGNSGGPLVNIKGQVVGINAMIVPSSGESGEAGFLGIGFAIPSNTVRHVMEDLVKTGKVSRGYLGAYVQSLSPGLAKEFDVPDTSGALVQNVEPNGPAAKAGIKNGDVIRKFNEQAVTDADSLTSQVTESNPGAEVTLDVLRNGKPVSAKVTLGERPANGSNAAGESPETSGGVLGGISVQNLTPALRNQLGVASSVTGVAVSQVDPNSPAAAYLQQGDVIESINRQPVRNVEDFNRLAGAAKGQVLLRVNRQGVGMYVVISSDGGQ
jgi:serine protease Do